jgi:hypothetical protein
MAIPILAILAGLGGAAVFQFISGLNPLKTVAEQTGNRLFPLQRVDPATAARLYVLGKITHEEYLGILRVHGLPERQADLLKDAVKRYLDASEVVAAYYREQGPGQPSESDLNAIAQRLIERGFSEDDAKKYALIAHPYPSPSDVIVWAVREAFSPDVVQRWGLDEAYPAELDVWGRAVGWTPEVLKYYWRAHWQWPSPTQAAEFVHRTNVPWWQGPKFSEQDYAMILRLADYVPGTIPLFKSILYNPFTRVDIRRMHKLGVIKNEDLVYAYKELGYDDWHAQKLAEFTIKYNADEEPTEERLLTRSLIERAYDLGLINDDEAIKMLRDLGYAEDKARLIVSILKTDKDMDRAEDFIGLYITQYKNGLIDEIRLRRKLMDLGLSLDMIEHYVTLAKEKAEQPEKIPSKTDIKALYSYGYITRAEAKDALMRLGLSDYWAEKLLLYWEGAPAREKAIQEATKKAAEELRGGGGGGE